MALFPVRRQEAELTACALRELKQDLDRTLLLTVRNGIVEEVSRLIYYMTRRLQEQGVREIEELDIRPKIGWGHELTIELIPKGPMGEALLEGLHELETEMALMQLETEEDPS